MKASLCVSYCFLSLLMLSARPAFAEEGLVTLKVTIENLSTNKGTLNYLVFDKERGFPDHAENAVRAGHLEIPADLKMAFDIEGLTPGEYAVSVYQDENKNGKLDKGFMGIPKEAVGASNDPKSRMGPPRFQDARIQVKAQPDHQPQVIVIHLVHP